MGRRKPFRISIGGNYNELEDIMVDIHMEILASSQKYRLYKFMRRIRDSKKVGR